MTELAKGLQESEKSAIVHATDLLTHYSFDLGDRTVSQLTKCWLKDFSASWIRSAVIEALYQGRYKAVSVDQILLLWKRRNQPCYHFNYEFERLVCNKFPRDLRQRSLNVSSIESDTPQPVLQAAIPPATSSDAEEAVPAWVALAEQIQRDDVIEPTRESGIDELTAPIQQVEVEDSLDLSDPLAIVEGIYEGVEAFLGRPISAEGIKKKQLSEEVELATGSIDETVDSEESQLPIHQFTPPPTTSDFHSKLKAVVESRGEEPS